MKNAAFNTAQCRSIRFEKTSLPARGNFVENSSSFIPDPSADTGWLYPESPASRSRWIIGQRGPKNLLNPSRPYAWLLEKERASDGQLVDGVAIFLTNKECPWRCLMCDLWQNTLDETASAETIAEQIDFALGLTECKGGSLAQLSQVKLYNAGSFFDEQAIPEAEDAAISERLAKFGRIIVECHPALIGDRCLRFRDRLSGQLEIALGLETVHPAALEKLNKRVTLEQFRAAAEFITRNEISLRTFVLLQPPFIPTDESVEWAKRSVDFSLDCGATVTVLIPTRTGNGAMDRLAAAGQFTEPALGQLEEVMDYGVSLARGRVFSDLWDLERFSSCNACFPQRRIRLVGQNDSQHVPARVICPSCR
ncbi:MAG TPA: radical SAM protein [Verrucomicrobiota bacterium]|nr:radical SAM protein [Verrucomicrobiota bacterium]